MSTARNLGLLDSEQQLREIMGETMELTIRKAGTELDSHSRDFIARSPLLCIGTANAQGRADVSPRGDRPGFVQVLDDNWLYIPDRPGNNRLDTMTNIIENPNVGLLFMVPGFNDTLRVNGKAYITGDETLADGSRVNGRAPKIGILVEVSEVFLHCAKAFIRSGLWKPESIQDRNEMPSLARMILDRAASLASPPSPAEIEEADKVIEENYRNELY